MVELKERTQILVERSTHGTLNVFCKNPTDRTKSVLSFFDVWSYNGGYYKNSDGLWFCEMSITMEDIILSDDVKEAFQRIGVEIITEVE